VQLNSPSQLKCVELASAGGLPAAEAGVDGPRGDVGDTAGVAGMPNWRDKEVGAPEIARLGAPR
jgi:hypothetical protein